MSTNWNCSAINRIFGIAYISRKNWINQGYQRRKWCFAIKNYPMCGPFFGSIELTVLGLKIGFRYNTIVKKINKLKEILK